MNSIISVFIWSVYNYICLFLLMGRWAGPNRALVTGRGTRSEIFQFNRFSWTGGLIKPGNLAKGTAQNLPKTASILPKADFPLAPFWSHT